MKALIRCSRCQRPYPEDCTPHRCSCGGLFDYVELPQFQSSMVNHRMRGMWKYASMLGLKEDSPVVTLGEGDTPLFKSTINGQDVYFKMESQNPTGSFKDRGTAVLLSFLLSRGVRDAVEDSSGNAGASFAAYAAKTGLSGTIYAPESTSGPKRRQIEMYGANLVRIPGPRSEAARAVLTAVEGGSVYASHAYMPFGLAGYATIAYELVDSLHDAPGVVIAPVGHGGLFLGIMLGFESLLRAGEIDRMPYFIGVQAQNCAPMVSAFRSGERECHETTVSKTLAEGASVANPAHAMAILDRVYSGMGMLTSASEHEIGHAYQMLAQQGIYCEPTSSLSITPLLNDKISIDGTIVSIITGTGYKTNTIL
ncbi:MAG: pyridoxal-phosphate dependent enzyme [Anaerolineaceae bacterium]|nr:pyridoxal-phosphate dependent enzyme [Anaerolineaceae bacterium]